MKGMSERLIYDGCPFCSSKKMDKIFTVKDYTVSNEKFEVYHCYACTNRFTQNVITQNDIGKYYQSENYISHSDTNKDFISKIYHSVRNLTLKSKRNLIVGITNKKNGNLLDVGAGTGAFSNVMVQAGWNVTSLEPDENARTVAKNKYNIDHQNTLELFNQQLNKYDAITLWHVLEHIHTLNEYLEQFHKIIHKNGKLVIAVPNYTSFDANFYQEYWAGYDVPRHLYHFSPTGMKILMEKFGFKIVSFKPMWFDSVYVSMLSEQYKTGKQNFFKAFFIGMISNAKAILNIKKCSSVIYIMEKQ